MDTIRQSVELLSEGKAVAQGDITLKQHWKIPEGLKKQDAEDGLLILAHSETGHHHAIDYSDMVDVYEQDELVSFVHNRSDNVVELKHHRNFDTHKPLGIPAKTIVKVVRGREYSPEGWRRVAD